MWGNCADAGADVAREQHKPEEREMLVSHTAPRYPQHALLGGLRSKCALVRHRRIVRLTRSWAMRWRLVLSDPDEPNPGCRSTIDRF